MYRKLSYDEIYISGLREQKKIECFNRLEGIDETLVNDYARMRKNDTAGVKYHFITTSSRIKIVFLSEYLCTYDYVTSNLITGIDVYCKRNTDYEFILTARPGNQGTEVEMNSNEEKEIYLILPPYARVNNLEVFIEKDATCRPIVPYKNYKPIVFYGSSITQGCAASRPGLTFPEIVSRQLGIKILNYGFSGGAQGEQVISKHLAEIEALAYVIEYDHNADNIELLELTHYPFIKTLSEKRPETVIIVMSRFSAGLSIPIEEAMKRRDIIQQSIDKLKRDNVYFIDGLVSMRNNAPREMLFADNKHPNDLGMYVIASSIIDVLEKNLLYSN